MISQKRCWDGNQKRVSWFRCVSSSKITFYNGSVDYHVQIRLDNMYFTSINDVNSFLVNINTNYLFFSGCEYRGSW
ncbi:hypothetical protein D3C76_1817010 [compost metagenome]